MSGLFHMSGITFNADAKSLIFDVDPVLSIHSVGAVRLR